MPETSVEELMAMVNRHYGVLDDDSPLPALPVKVVPWDDLPRTPPEALARLEQAKANARTYNRLYTEAAVHTQNQGYLRPLTDLCTSLAQKSRDKPKTTDKQFNELAKAHGTMGNHMGIPDKLTRS
jgi:hypothetical protein